MCVCVNLSDSSRTASMGESPGYISDRDEENQAQMAIVALARAVAFIIHSNAFNGICI